MPRKNSVSMTDPGIAKIGRAPKAKRTEKFDALAPGLSLRVTDNGTKTFSVYYRLNGKHKRMTLGRWPGLGIAEARTRAREVKEQAKAGINPNTVSQAAADAARREAEEAAQSTFGAIAEDYIRRECPKLRHGKSYEAVIRRDLIPAWRDRPLAELRRRDLIRITDRLVDQGKPSAAYRTFELAKRIGNWAVERDVIEASAFAAMKPPTQKVARARVLDDGEIVTLWGTWDEMGYPWGDLLKLLLLTGQRRSEVAESQWPEFDIDKAEWIIPAARAKSDREHFVPLSGAALSILEGLPRFTKGDFLFTSMNGRRPVSGFSKLKEQMDEKSGVEGWRVHDLRRTTRTRLAALGVPEIVAGRILNHVERGMSGVYNRYEYADERRAALERWAQAIADLVTPPPANVVAMQKAKSA